MLETGFDKIGVTKEQGMSKLFEHLQTQPSKETIKLATMVNQ